MFCLAAALLLLEVTTTRMLSVALAYHFAVLSISLAMLGLAVGGVFVHVAQAGLARRGVLRTATIASLLSAAAILFALLTFLGLPLQPVPSFAGFLNLLLLFLPQALPYLSIGIAMSALLLSYPASVGKLYFADLLGAAVGCAASVLVLPLVGGGGAVLIAALLAVGAAAALAGAIGAPRLPRPLAPRRWAAALAGCLVLAVFTRTFELNFVKGTAETPPEKVVWTTHSRVTFSKSLENVFPYGWGFGAKFDPARFRSTYRTIRIDGLAETPIIRLELAPIDLSYLFWDVSSLPYLMKREGRALIIGAGGGRDIAAAHVSGRWSIDAVEINPAIARALRTDYASYSGHIYDLPEVHVRVIDGRSALETSAPSTYDLVQMSAVDTWAAGSTGAFALMENSLYTVESFRAILRCLKPMGYLSVSRFKYPADQYGETVRMVAIALEALDRQGAPRPSSHVLLATNFPSEDYRLATMLVKPSPFTREEIDLAAAAAAAKGFQIVWPPGPLASANPAVRLLATRTRGEREDFFSGYPIDVRPTFDDRPYFFHQNRLSTLGRSTVGISDAAALRLIPLLTILRLGIFLLVMCVVLVLYPMVRPAGDGGARPKPATSDLLYFAALGVGFMLYEIPLVQQLTLALGHPSQALSVALAGLLLGTGVGSFLTTSIDERGRRALHALAGATAVAVGVCLALFGQRITEALLVAAPAARVFWAFGLVLAVGVPLGTLFPLGVRRLVAKSQENRLAWFWAANGAAGVLASVLALILGTEVGMRSTYLVGSATYLLALGVVLLSARVSRPRQETARTRAETI